MKSTIMKGALIGLMGGTVLILAGCAAEENTGTTLLIDKVNVPSTPTAISTSNQNTVVAETSDSVDGALTVGGSAPVGASLQDQAASGFSIFDFARGPLLDTVRQGLVQQQNLPAAIAVTQSVACDSGSMSLTLNLNNPISTTLQPGDSFSVRFDNCNDSQDGTTSNGSMSATVDSGTLEAGCDATGTCSDFSLGMNFNDLQITEMGETALIDGGFTLVYASATNTNTISGNDFYMYSSTGQGVHMSNFNIASTLSGSTETTTVTMTLASTRINGSVQIQTTAPLVTTNIDADDYPSSGTLEITGANSKLTVTATSSSSVLLELDEDNDGTLDQSATVNWTVIESAP